MAARNRVRIEGTLKRSPQAWKLTDGRRRAIFTVRVERGNGKADYIDCCAYGDLAVSMEVIAPFKQVEITGWLMTFNKMGEGKAKRTTLVVESWAYMGAPIPLGE